MSGADPAHSTQSLIVRGRYVIRGILPSGDADIVENGAVLVEGGRIARLCHAADLSSLSSGREDVIGSASDVVMPGLINAHHHSGLTPLQHGTPFLPLERWLPRFLGWRSVDPYLDTLYAAIEMVESGVTTVQHIQGPPAGPSADWLARSGAMMNAYADIGMRTSFSFMWGDRNSIVYGSDEAFFETLPPELKRELGAVLAAHPTRNQELAGFAAECVNRWHRPPDGLSAVQLAPANLQWCSDESLAMQRDLAVRHSLKMHMHLLETPYQWAFAHRTLGKSAVQYLEELGLLTPDMTLGHCIWASERDIDLIAAAGSCICHNPSSGLRLSSGIAPLHEFLAAGIPVALGIDQATINDDRDMLLEMRLAWNLQRTPGLQREPPTAGQIFRMATEHGARSTAFGDRLGRLEAGRAADIVVIDGAELESPGADLDTPLLDLLLHRAKIGMVKDVLIGGQAVMRDRQIRTIDKSDVMRALKQALARPPTDDERARRRMTKLLDPYVRAFYAEWKTPSAHAAYRSWNARG